MSNLSLETSMKLSQTLSPQMIQSLKLLQYSSLQLEQVLRKEIQENPILEEASEEEAPTADNQSTDESRTEAAVTAEASDAKDEEAGEPMPKTMEEDDAKAVIPETNPIEEVNWSDFEGENYSPSYKKGLEENDENSSEMYEKIPVSFASLEEHLLKQLQEKKLSPKQMEIGEFIIGNIDDKGYLVVSVSDIAEKFETTPAFVNEIRNSIQHFDPLGVASIDLRENLLTQCRAKGLGDSLMSRIIEQHFDLLKKYQMPEIAKKLGVSVQDVQQAVREIGHLEPNPGTLISSQKPQIITPELMVSKQDNGEFLVSLIDGNVPNIKISRPYLDLLRKEKKRTPEIKKYISEKLNSANWLIRAIEQRKVTMIKVMTAIVEKQKEWFEKGPPHLSPLRLQEIADIISMHISTVCRVTNDKYVQTPYGIFELKYFFGSGVEQDDGTEVSTSRAKDILKELVQQEAKKKPLSDQKLVDLLKERGIEVARRTISKYREQLSILPARLRKEF